MKPAAALLFSALAVSCASYQFLPLKEGASSFDYRSTRLFFFHNTASDASIERIFSDPRPGGAILVTVRSPAPGVASSTDGGASWSFFKLGEDASAPHILRAVVFDPTDTHRIYAQFGNGLLVSRDGGKSFQQAQIAQEKPRYLDALALGPDGTVYAALADQLYASNDHALGFFPLPFELSSLGAKSRSPKPTTATPAEPGAPRVRIRSILPDPTHHSTLYVSVETEAPAEFFQKRLLGLLDGNSDESAQVRALFTLPTDHPTDRASFGDPRAGVYVSRDGGRGWQKTPLGIDSWLVAYNDTVAAVAAEPLLIAAGLAQRSPAVAAMIATQLHEDKSDAGHLRPSLQFPGRDALLAFQPSSLFFQSTDQAASWTHLTNPELPLALAMRGAVEDQRTARSAWPPKPRVQSPQQANNSQPQSGSGRGRGGRGGRGQQRRSAVTDADLLAPPPDLTEPLLTLLNPTLLLAHLGAGLPLTGISNLAGSTLWAWAPTAEYWSQLAEALIHATREETELTLGGASAPPPDRNSFQLLRSDDSGKTWSPISTDAAGASNPAAWPAFAAAFGAQSIFLLVDRDALGAPSYTFLREP